jgi:hypothetical protein
MNPFLEKWLRDAAESGAKNAVESGTKNAVESEARTAAESGAKNAVESSAKNELTKTTANKLKSAELNSVGEEFKNAPQFKVDKTPVSPEDFEAVHSAQQGMEAPERGTRPNFNPDTATQTEQLGRAIPENSEPSLTKTIDSDPTMKMSDLNAEPDLDPTMKIEKASNNLGDVIDNSKEPTVLSTNPNLIDSGQLGDIVQDSPKVNEAKASPKTLQEKLQFLKDKINTPTGKAAGIALGGAALLTSPSDKYKYTQPDKSDKPEDIDERSPSMKLTSAQGNSTPLSDEDLLRLQHGDEKVPNKENLSGDDMEMDSGDAGSANPKPEQPESTSLPKSQNLADLLSNSTPPQNEFANAQNRQTMAILGNQLGAAGDIIAGGLTRQGPNAQAQALFKEQAGQAGNISKQYQERIAMQEQDPNSEVSKQVRDRLKKVGVNVSDNLSAAQLNKYIEPAVEKEQLQASRLKAQQDNKNLQLQYLKQKQDQLNVIRDNAIQTKKSTMDTNRIDKANKLITAEVASSRSAFGRAANTNQAAEKIETLTQGIDPNNLDKRQIAEIARNLDGMLANGQPSISGMNKLLPASASGDVSKIMEYIGNIPKGAQQGEFVNRLMATVSREKQLSHDQMSRTQGKLLGSYSDLKDHPSFKAMLRQQGIPEDIFDQQTNSSKPQSINQQSPKESKSSGEIRRLDPASGKVAVFDANKKFVRFE